MKRFLLPALVAVFFAGAACATAQVRAIAVGPKVGLYFDGSRPMVGAIAEIPLTPVLDFEPGVEFLFPGSGVTQIVPELNGRYSFNVQGSEVRPFLLGGLGLAFTFVSAGGDTKTDSDFRLNLGGGTVFNSRSLVQYWAGLKLYILSKAGSDIGLMGGVNFYL